MQQKKTLQNVQAGMYIIAVTSCKLLNNAHSQSSLQVYKSELQRFIGNIN